MFTKKKIGYLPPSRTAVRCYLPQPINLLSSKRQNSRATRQAKKPAEKLKCGVKDTRKITNKHRVSTIKSLMYIEAKV